MKTAIAGWSIAGRISPGTGLMLRSIWLPLAAVWGLVHAFYSVPAAADELILFDGRVLRGAVGESSGMAELPGASQNPDRGRPIRFVDDDLARRFIPKRRILEANAVAASQPIERFRIKQPVARAGNSVVSVGPAVEITPFTQDGRRTFSLMTERGRLDIIQGITEITPDWTKVAGLKNQIWDMRIRTSSIPREQLDLILRENIDPKNVEDRLKIVRLYIQSGRYGDAKAQLDGLIRDFPDLTEQLEESSKELRQSVARQQLAELKIRQTAGQHELVMTMLAGFDTNDVAGQILQEVLERQRGYENDLDNVRQITKEIRKLAWQVSSGHNEESTVLLALTSLESGGSAAGLGGATAAVISTALAANGPDANRGLAAQLDLITQELNAQVSVDTLSRFTAFTQALDDPAMTPQEKLALGLSGWVVGNDSSVTNLQVALSLYETRRLVIEYLLSNDPAARKQILASLRSQEGAVPSLVTKLLQNMAPPAPLPEEAHPEIPLFFKVAVPGVGNETINYLVQLPPEYHPLRRYPTIITLHGERSTPENQIGFWSGQPVAAGENRAGQGTRYGYIVIAPEWVSPDQTDGYGYSPQEHAAVLYTLRDAFRRFSIDTDKVFLTGHGMGGDAAWDIGLSHPDLWAGVLPITGTAEKYCQFYWQNAENVSLYAVDGELNGTNMVTNANVLDRCFRDAFDITVVEYLGRGDENFYDDILEMYDWMQRKQRNFKPQEFKCRTMRDSDTFFWWMEFDGLPEKSRVHPADWPPPSGTRGMTVTGEITAGNGLQLTAGGDKLTIWLSPEMVDFNEPITVRVGSKRKKQNMEPNLEVLLEDVRTRGDRQHPFWAKIDWR